MGKPYFTQAISEVYQTATYLQVVVADLSTKAEPWWIDYLSRHPVLIPYAAGIKRFDKIYLDTSFVGRTKTHQLFSPKVCSSSPGITQD